MTDKERLAALTRRAIDDAGNGHAGSDECPKCGLPIAERLESVREIEEGGKRWTCEKWECWLCGTLDFEAADGP